MIVTKAAPVKCNVFTPLSDDADFKATPKMPKTQFIADLAVGDEVSSLFLLGAAQQGQAKNGPF